MARLFCRDYYTLRLLLTKKGGVAVGRCDVETVMTAGAFPLDPEQGCGFNEGPSC